MLQPRIATTICAHRGTTTILSQYVMGANRGCNSWLYSWMQSWLQSWLQFCQIRGTRKPSAYGTTALNKARLVDLGIKPIRPEQLTRAVRAFQKEWGRVDRLIVTDSEVLIVDFKTDQPAPDSPEKVADTYKAQMAAYWAVLQKAYPGRNVRAALCWTDGPRLMFLPEDMLLEALNSAQSVI